MNSAQRDFPASCDGQKSTSLSPKTTAIATADPSANPNHSLEGAM
jgi:hypothetical protein